MKKKKIIVYQRILPKYRFELFKELAESEFFEEVRVVATKGMKEGAQASYNRLENSGRLRISIIRSLNFIFNGTRKTFIPFYPQSFFLFLSYDYLILEGTTNFLNNIFLVLLSKLSHKKIVWWDAGYSEKRRSLSRKIKDFLLGGLIFMTDFQMAYSTKAKLYLEEHMRAKNCFVNINTISTSFFLKKYDLYQSLALDRLVDLNKHTLNLLYVGAIEERKNLWSCIELLEQLIPDYHVNFTIIGNGSYLFELDKLKSDTLVNLEVLPAIYDFNDLESYYIKSHLFVLPGEGGLAIIQAMQFGLPVVTVQADGTEMDYIDSGNNGFICENINLIPEVIMNYFLNLNSNEKIDLYGNVIEKAKKISSKSWIEKIEKYVSC